MLATGEEIFRLIPQRPPMVMVDALYEADAEGGETGLTVKEDNVFCIDSQLIEPGIIEHSAQVRPHSPVTDIFWRGEEPHIGLIGEIKSFRIERKPAVGETLKTRVAVVGEAMGMSLVQTETFSGGEKIAGGQIKIFIVD